MTVKRSSDHEVLDTLYDALQIWKQGKLSAESVCLILQAELEPSVLTDADRNWAIAEAKRLRLQTK